MGFQMYKCGRQRNILISMNVGDVAHFNCSHQMLWYRLKRATKQGFVYKWVKCINGGYCVECVQDTVDKLPTAQLQNTFADELAKKSGVHPPT